MSCFWDSISNSIINEDKYKYFYININELLKPQNIVTILKNINNKTTNVLWNNQSLTQQNYQENIEHIKDYKVDTIYNGYLCSSCDPFLCLLCEYLNVNIEHKYNGTLIHYTNTKSTRYTIKISSDRGHCWKQ